MELRAESEAGRFGVWHDGAPIGTVDVVTGEGTHRLVVRTRPVTERADARALLDALADAAGRLGARRDVDVEVWDDLVRLEARRAGWTGALRGLLRPWPPTDAARGDPTGVGDVVRAIDALLPDASVVSGLQINRRVQTLRVATPTSRRALRLKFEADRGELMPEVIAGAIDTTLAVKRRFGKAAAGVLALSFDHGGPQFASGAIAGSASGATGTIFLNPNMIFVDDVIEQRRRVATGATGTSAAVPPPYTALDGVTAHELWHNLDAVIHVRGSYVEFNRLLGEALGVDTLEHALRGAERGAPLEWQAARVQLAREVSAYATTQPREATAEMFKVWWCSSGELTPVVARFGELVDRFFPSPTAATEPAT